MATPIMNLKKVDLWGATIYTYIYTYNYIYIYTFKMHAAYIYIYSHMMCMYKYIDTNPDSDLCSVRAKLQRLEMSLVARYFLSLDVV